MPNCALSRLSRTPVAAAAAAVTRAIPSRRYSSAGGLSPTQISENPNFGVGLQEREFPALLLLFGEQSPSLWGLRY